MTKRLPPGKGRNSMYLAVGPVILASLLVGLNIWFFQQALANRQMQAIVLREVNQLGEVHLVDMNIVRHQKQVDLFVLMETDQPLSEEQLFHLRERIAQEFGMPVDLTVNIIPSRPRGTEQPQQKTLFPTMTHTPTPNPTFTPTATRAAIHLGTVTARCHTRSEPRALRPQDWAIINDSQVSSISFEKTPNHLRYNEFGSPVHTIVLKYAPRFIFARTSPVKDAKHAHSYPRPRQPISDRRLPAEEAFYQLFARHRRANRRAAVGFLCQPRPGDYQFRGREQRFAYP